MSIYSEIPFSINWGSFTPDGYNATENKALFIYNLKFSNPIEIERNYRFVRGKAYWAKVNLPVGCEQKIIFDIRGQVISNHVLNLFIEKLKQSLKFIDNTIIEIKST